MKESYDALSRSSKKHGDKLSVLGYGCMRFPMKMQSINEKLAEKQILHALNQGVNYFDTAVPYHNGKSEPFLSKVFSKNKCLTADNCVSQNKNNPVIHYLLFRTMMGLHDEINLSFMIVGHTKFGQDGYFGLIRRFCRKSKIYTYNQLAELIRKSSPNGHVLCQPFLNEKSEQNYSCRQHRRN